MAKVNFEKIKTIDDLGDIKGKKVLLRLSLNVPVEKGSVVDPFRIEMSIPTIMELRNKGAKVILLSHIGRDPKETLEPIMRYLQDSLPVVFIRDIFSPNAKKMIDYAAPGSVVVLENLRQHAGEEKNDPEFSKHLASFGDIYINDSFPECHRAHASIVGITEFLPSFAGRQLMKEITNLSKTFETNHPFLFILGGAKVETKLPLINNFLDKADNIFIGGILANDFLKTMNLETGKSALSNQTVPKELLSNKKIILPTDIVVERNGKKENISHDSVLENDKIFDIGRKSVETVCDLIKNAKFILWNGPVGFCEGGFCEGTESIANAIANSKAVSVVGGGDTLASVSDEIQSKMTFISTGGGAMLDYLANENLPGIEALEK
ncbi:MAG: phosphoglycerate kinase [Candidatus Pacebacteria bacterium]|nr:phosphoglycerate kinase [Candidatus Paceibacterota bacterium]